jgi:hypothetical protein
MGWCGWLFAWTLPNILPRQQPITGKEKHEIKHGWYQKLKQQSQICRFYHNIVEK